MNAKGHDNTVLEARGIVKEFSGIRVLDSIDFDLRKGEVHVIVGENGAGKSTLVKILTGVYGKDEGKILVDGNEAQIRNRNDALAHGIGIVFQEFSLIPALSVAENMFVGHLPSVSGLRPLQVVDWKRVVSKAKKALEDFGINIDPLTKIRSLGIAIQQLVEIAKALVMNSRILIMDEPTATLSKYEIEHLFQAINGLKAKGVSIIYISHRLNEVGLIGDRVTVLKDGRKVATVDIENTSTEKIIRMMMGRDINEIFPTKAKCKKDTILRIENLTAERAFYDVSFEVHEGEILGITGLVGSGKTELAHALFGIIKKTSGAIWVNDKRIEIRSPLKAKRAGLGLLPEDRKRNGVIAALNVRENIGLPNLEQFMKYGFIIPRKELKTIREYMGIVDIRPNDPQKKVRFLSGGNQQKVVLSKWLCSKSKLFIFDEPTRGIDVGSKFEIYKLMNYLTQSGCGIIMISSEIPEIIGMSDRILVMNKGEVISIFDREEATSEMILHASIGKKLTSQGSYNG